MAIEDDFAVDGSGNVRHVSGTTIYSVLDLHAYLQAYSTNLTPSGDDNLSMQTKNPSALDGKRSTVKQMYLNLTNGFNIDQTASQFLKFGSVVQNGGNDQWTGLKTIGSPLVANSPIYMTQNGNKVTKFWSDTGHLQILVRAISSGSPIDSGNLIVWSRKYGQTYSNFTVNLLAGGEEKAALSTTITDWTTLSKSAALALSSKVSIAIGNVNYDTGDGNGSKLYKGTITLSGGVTVAEAAQYLQAICDETSTTTINGILGWKFTTLDPSYIPNSAAPFGSVAGGKWFVEQGWLVLGAIPSDSLKYQMKSDDGTAVSNPIVTVLSVGELVVGSSVEVARDDGAGWIIQNEYTLNGNHAIGSSTITINESIKSDTPVSGVIIVNKKPLVYTAYNAGSKQFTLESVTLVAFTTGASAYVPFIYKVAASSVEASANFLFNSAFTARAIVRKSTSPSKQEFNATFSVGVNGGSVNAIQNPDE